MFWFCRFGVQFYRWYEYNWRTCTELLGMIASVNSSHHQSTANSPLLVIINRSFRYAMQHQSLPGGINGLVLDHSLSLILIFLLLRVPGHHFYHHHYHYPSLFSFPLKKATFSTPHADCFYTYSTVFVDFLDSSSSIFGFSLFVLFFSFITCVK